MLNYQRVYNHHFCWISDVLDKPMVLRWNHGERRARHELGWVGQQSSDWGMKPTMSWGYDTPMDPIHPIPFRLQYDWGGQYQSHHCIYLVGGCWWYTYPPEKYESDWIIIPTIGEKCSKPPTSIPWYSRWLSSHPLGITWIPGHWEHRHHRHIHIHWVCPAHKMWVSPS
jgi:hypothetical protein